MHSQRKSLLIRFFELDAAPGILLFIAAVLALIAKNSPLASVYDKFITLHFSIKVGAFELTKSLLIWINEGFMTIFFFLIGLELKREIIGGELSSPKKILFPAFGAVGGMVVPAIIYLLVNHKNPLYTKGWAIPTATDIAFALGVLTLLGDRVPRALKVFLVSLAIFDDIGAIIIIAVFYSCDINIMPLFIVAALMVVLFIFNYYHLTRFSLYILIGLFMWLALLKSGLHATLTGVLLAFFIPLKPKQGSNVSMLKRVESDLSPSVSFIILPLFAFANSGLNFNFGETTVSQAILHSVPVGVFLGLFVGKQLGVFCTCWLATKLNIIKKPGNISWLMLYGVSILCGIGFTMSLFIGSLSFKDCATGTPLINERLGILLGSLCSGILGYCLLRYKLNKS